jgi:hypothetical protein
VKRLKIRRKVFPLFSRFEFCLSYKCSSLWHHCIVIPCLIYLRSVTDIWHPSSAGDSDVDMAANKAVNTVASWRQCHDEAPEQCRDCESNSNKFPWKKKFSCTVRCLEVVSGLLHLAALTFTSPGLVMFVWKRTTHVTSVCTVPSNLKVYSLLMGRQMGLFLCRETVLKLHSVLHTNECTNYILYISLKYITLKHFKCSYMFRSLDHPQTARIVSC